MDIRYLSEADDRLELSNVYEESWKHAYKGIIPQDYLDSIPKGRWATSLDREGMHSLVMVDNGRIVGTSCWCSSRWEDHPGWGEIVSIYFLPGYMGKGYGTMLLERCVNELRTAGFKNILLWVLEDNHRARRFYEKNGFTAADDFLDDEIGGKKLREIMYIRSI